MADTKISELDEAGVLSGNELVPLVQSGTKRATTGSIAALALYDSVTALSISSGNVTVDLAVGANRLFTLTLTESVTGWTFDNKPGSGKGGSIWITITQGSTAYTVAMPSGAIHTGGQMPTGSGDKAALAMTTTDNWTTIFATIGVAES